MFWKYRWYASDRGKPFWLVFFRKLKTFIRLSLGIPNPLVKDKILDRTFIVRDGTIRRPPDMDDAWYLALAWHSEVIFDIGAHVGYTALLASFSPKLTFILLVDANPNALVVAAENLIRNHLESKAHFLWAFVGSPEDKQVRFWTYDVAAVSSVYRRQFKRIGSSSYIDVPVVTIDWMCGYYD